MMNLGGDETQERQAQSHRSESGQPGGGDEMQKYLFPDGRIVHREAGWRL